MILGGINLLLNYQLINLYGLTGAALATFASIFLFNVLKSGFVYFRYGMQPFSRNFYRIVVFSILISLCYYLVPRFENPFVHIVVFTLIIGAISLFLIHVLKVDTDFIPFLRKKAIGLISRGN